MLMTKEADYVRKNDIFMAKSNTKWLVKMEEVFLLSKFNHNSPMMHCKRQLHDQSWKIQQGVFSLVTAEKING